MSLNFFLQKIIKRALEKVHLLGNNEPGTYRSARARRPKSPYPGLRAGVPGRGLWLRESCFWAGEPLAVEGGIPLSGMLLPHVQ